VFFVISVYFNIRNTLPKSGTFLRDTLFICPKIDLRVTPCASKNFGVGINPCNVKVKVKTVEQSHYRPGQALTCSRRFRLPDFKTIDT
jgi:hypothetical protein